MASEGLTGAMAKQQITSSGVGDSCQVSAGATRFIRLRKKMLLKDLTSVS